MKKLYLVLLTLSLSVNLFSQVAINTDGSQPHASAMLDVKSSTGGLLIPRMTAQERGQIQSPAEGLMVYQTDGTKGFYYYDGSNWSEVDADDGDWTISGNNMSAGVSGNVGIGISPSNTKLDIRNNNEISALKLSNYSSNSVGNKVIEAYIYGSDNSNKTGFHFSTNNSGNGHHRGISNTISGSGNGEHTGVYNKLSNGTGMHYGIYNELSGANTNYKHYAVYNKFTGGGSNENYGVYNRFASSTTGDVYGLKNMIYNPQDNDHYGVYSFLHSSGDGEHYGVFNELCYTGSGNQFGTYDSIYNSGDGKHYGRYSILTGSGSGNKYGSYNKINSSAGGTHFAVYGEAEKTGSYAAYFKGQAYISDSLGIGTNNPQAELDVNGHIRMTDGNEAVGKVLISDANGTASWGDAGDADFYRANTAHQVPSSITDTIYTEGSVAIGTTAPDASAKLEVNSSVQGFLPPRMTATQMNAIASPAEGLMVYNTTVKSVCFYDGTAWHKTYNNDGVSCGDISYGGQTYSTVVIGTQCWMAENLNIGTAILGSQDQTDNGVIEKYCNDDQTSNCDTYGGLYQWNEMMQYVTTAGTQGICPSGWHLPTDNEWKTLEMYLGMSNQQANNYNLRGTDEGSKIAGTPGSNLWIVDALSQNANFGVSGFNALPGGSRGTNGLFYGLTGFGRFWTSNGAYGGTALNRYLNYNSTQVGRQEVSRVYGYSVRCVRD